MIREPRRADGQRPGDEEWHRAENWYGGWLGLYHAPRDPRVWVPKRPPHFGWTLNFGLSAWPSPPLR